MNYCTHATADLAVCASCEAREMIEDIWGEQRAGSKLVAERVDREIMAMRAAPKSVFLKSQADSEFLRSIGIKP
jgi:hypothetical protein